MECGELLLASDVRVLGVITSAPRVREWAQAKGLPCRDLDGPWCEELAREPFDYLFAITHLELLDAKALALPQRGAINFHDAPLPTYSGLFCPAWALIDGVETYGVTWHWIDAGIDTGDVLETEAFDVSPRETSLTINTKCFQAGLESFERLTLRLLAGDEGAAPQPAGDRRLCRSNERPAGAGLLDWSRPAEELDRLVRALDFGTYPNPFGIAKAQLGDRAVLVRGAEISSDSAPAGSAPGSIVASNPQGIEVVCGSGVLRLTSLEDLEGNEVLPENLAVSGPLEVPASDRLQAIHRIAERQAGKRERRLTQRLIHAQPASLPHVRAQLPAGATLELGTRDLQLPAGSGGDPAARALELAAGFVGYLSRVTGEEIFDIAIRHPEVDAAAAGLEPFVCTRLPVRFAPDLDQPLQGLANKVGTEIERAARRGPWMRDLLARIPELRGGSSGGPFPVGLQFAGTDPMPTVGHELTFSVDPVSLQARLVFDRSRLDEVTVERIAKQLEVWFAALHARPDARLAEIRLLSDDERNSRAEAWRSVHRGPVQTGDLASLLEARVDADRSAIALHFEGETCTFGELDERANRLAHELLALGAGPSSPVGLHLERSIDLVTGLWAVWKAGAPYLPLDPEYPADRLEWMLADSGTGLVVTTSEIEGSLRGAESATRLRLDSDAARIAEHPAVRPVRQDDPARLAYLIYTSGSTGRPKGVQVEARNVANFFRGMDERVELPSDPNQKPGVWCAVTSLSFDISVLELAYSLTRGFEVVVFRDRERQGSAAGCSQHPAKVDFSVFLWGNDDGPGSQKYRLTLESAKLADEYGFRAIWTPERHFHAFGGPFPNPSVISAAIAATTQNIGIRAGSCVLPLHHPIRVAEEWAVVDNLSGGRVGIAFASGWQPDDFVLAPENFKANKQVMVDNIDVVRRLWRGESVEFENPFGEKVARETLPRPMQPELPIWITSAGNPETYRIAGRLGANVLTHLLGQSVEDVADKIRIYREARAEAGFDPATGVVTIMLHTYVAEDLEQVRETVRGPLKSYLEASVGLVKKYAWSFPAFKRPGAPDSKEDLSEISLDGLSAEEQDAVLEHAFNRYFEQSGLFGTPETCLARVDELKAIGVDEIGCLIDYGVSTDLMLECMPRIAELMERSRPTVPVAGDLDLSLAATLERHQVTHLQCTPSMARMLLADDRSRKALGNLRHMMVGGEATSPELADELCSVAGGRVTNMYGPTETTIWSTTSDFVAGAREVSIGTPIANTRVYVLDANHRPMPTGIPGELWIGGDGVVRGYHGRPDLTDQRFVADPFHPGARMYRTGDLAYFHADGSLGFLGRNDHQVKVRGHRIELGEIESAITDCAGVREAVCLAREDTPGDVRLVGYVVGTKESFEENRLKGALRKRLPGYMVPARIVRLDALPLTPNGKLDRAALPRPEALETREMEYRAPESELESSLADLWRTVLGLEQVGAEDNFFELGGHSLLVVKLHRDLVAALKRPVSLTDLYRFPTIKGLADFLTTGGSSEGAKASAKRGEARRSALAARGRRGARRPPA